MLPKSIFPSASLEAVLVYTLLLSIAVPSASATSVAVNENSPAVIVLFASVLWAVRLKVAAVVLYSLVNVGRFTVSVNAPALFCL